MKTKYNKSDILKAAWKMYKKSYYWTGNTEDNFYSFGYCLKTAWNNAKVFLKLDEIRPTNTLLNILMNPVEQARQRKLQYNI